MGPLDCSLESILGPDRSRREPKEVHPSRVDTFLVPKKKGKFFLETGRLAPGILQKLLSEGHMSWENGTLQKKIDDLTTLFPETRPGTRKNGVLAPT